MQSRCKGMIAAVALGAALCSSAAEISSTTLKAVFDDAGKGRLAALLDRHGRNYISVRNVDSPLWQVEACKAGAFTEKAIIRANQARRYAVRAVADGIELTWEDAGEAVEKAVATFLAKPGDPAIRCRITVTPKKGWALVETQFPRFAMNECLGTTPTDDAIVMGTGHGGLLR